MMRKSSILEKRWVNIVPHINDTILLVSAIILSVLSAQYPISSAWINVKIIALIIYIVLGSIALKRGSTMTIRIFSLCAALIVFSYIIVVANVKQVIPF